MDTTFNFCLQDIKKDIYRGIDECNKRGLSQSAKFLAELNHGLKVAIQPPDWNLNRNSGISPEDYDDYQLAKSYFDNREYDRASYFTKSSVSPVPKFLHLYSNYMAKEKKRLDNMTENSTLNNNNHFKDLSDLLTVLKNEHGQKQLDGFGLYLYGVVLKKLDLNVAAIPIFLESITAEPTMWGSWLELSPLISNKEKLHDLSLPNHWMKHFFVAFTYVELFLNDEGLKYYEELQLAGFEQSVYITSQMAIAHHNKRDVEKAIEIFKHLQVVDPYRLDNLDIYSNLLFVKEMKKEMAFLAHKAVEINKYRPETCCVVANYYSIRADHHKAVIYFQRALKLNPKYLSAWTLMGHEFMEMKNTNAAIQSYRQAVEVNRRDFRAWYGLGQAYEILKMPFYSLFYYKMAQQFRPHDSRMLVALGEIYEKLDKQTNALKCYQRACNVGDIEGNAMFKLASLYEKLGDLTNAVPAYLNFCEDERAVVDKTSLCRAYMVLANYYDKEQAYDKATYFANKCLDHEEAKSEAKALLKHIANKREKQAAGSGGAANVEEIEMEECDMVIETEGGPTTPGGTTLDEAPVDNENLEDLNSMDMSSSVLYE